MRPSSENQSIDYEMAKLRSEIGRLRDFARQVELNTREGPPLVLKLNWLAHQALGLHASDCAVNNAPALPVGPCDCGLDARLKALEGK